MSEENNSYENSNEETQYTQAPITEEPVYNGEAADYSSGKGQGQGLGFASMVCGIIYLIGCCGLWYVSIPLAVAAIITGIMQIVKNEARGMAIAGIVCGAIGVILSILVIVGSVALITSGVYEELVNQYGIQQAVNTLSEGIHEGWKRP